MTTVQSESRAPAPRRGAVPCEAHLACARRSRCLDAAVAGDWPFLDCSSCTAFEPVDAVQLRADVEGIAGVLAAVAVGTRRSATSRNRAVRARLVAVASARAYSTAAALATAAAAVNGGVSVDRTAQIVHELIDEGVLVRRAGRIVVAAEVRR